MDPDPDVSDQILVLVLSQCALLWTVHGIQQEKEE